MPRLLLLVCAVCLATAFKIPADWKWAGVVDHYVADHILSLRNSGQTEIRTTIDLGKSQSRVTLTPEGIAHEKSLLATWDELIEIAEKRQGCWAVYDDGSKPWRVSALSKNTQIPASLCPPLGGKTGAPTMVLGGFTMHRIAGDGMNPTVDTAAKISAVSSALFPGASVLDTCCGLGYTAIGAAEKVGGNGRVVSIELDEASLEMCAYNPWSSGLFDGKLPIEVMQGDSCEICKSLPDGVFNAIIHDPPARALCRKGLYSLDFYKSLRRLLKPSGTLFHYIGRFDSKESGSLYRGITERLHSAGFKTVKRRDSAFGLVATGLRESPLLRADDYEHELGLELESAEEMEREMAQMPSSGRRSVFTRRRGK